MSLVVYLIMTLFYSMIRELKYIIKFMDEMKIYSATLKIFIYLGLICYH